MRFLEILKQLMQNGFSVFIFVLSAILIFVIFRLIFNLIDYILFKKIIAALLDEILDESGENKLNEKLPNSEQEDEIIEERNKDKEKIVEVERFNEPNQQEKINFQKKIVGIKQKKIFGKWTEMIVARFASRIQNLDLSELKNLGIHQAEEKARERSRGIRQENGFQRGRGL